MGEIPGFYWPDHVKPDHLSALPIATSSLHASDWKNLQGLACCFQAETCLFHVHGPPFPHGPTSGVATVQSSLSIPVQMTLNKDCPTDDEEGQK